MSTPRMSLEDALAGIQASAVSGCGHPVGMSLHYPRRPCPTCRRSIAVPGGRFARHDPPDHGAIRGFLVSCTGSLTPAPLGGEQPPLFEADLLSEIADLAAVQEELFG
jgi:hypothetical protein